MPGPGRGRPRQAAPRPGPGRAEAPESRPEAEPAPSGPGPNDGASDLVSAAPAAFQTYCARCHNLGGGRGGRGKGPNLSYVGANHDVAWLMDHIRNPMAHNPNSKMPPFEGKINDGDIRQLAEYLASLK